jgi:selenocysteine-specific elongation factor
LVHTVKEFATANPLSGGISRQELAERSGLERVLFATAVETLLGCRRIEITDELLHLPDRRVTLRDEEAASRQQIKDAFAAAGIRVPALKDVLAELPIDQDRARKIVALLMREKILLKVGEELVFHRDTLAALRQQVRAMKTSSPNMDVARFKEAFGLSRKYAIPLLEYLDREGVTRRAGDERIIL